MGCQGVPGPGAAPPVSPTPGVTGTRPASPPPPAAGWERGAGGGPRFPAQPLLPRDMSLRTSERTQTPAPLCPPPGHPAGHSPGEVGTGAQPPPPRAAHNSQPAANQPSPPSQILLPVSATLPPPNAPAPRDPHRGPTTGDLPTRGRGKHPPNHAPPHHRSDVTRGPRPPDEMPPHPQHPPNSLLEGGWGEWGPPCPRSPPVPGS